MFGDEYGKTYFRWTTLEKLPTLTSWVSLMGSSCVNVWWELDAGQVWRAATVTFVLIRSFVHTLIQSTFSEPSLPPGLKKKHDMKLKWIPSTKKQENKWHGGWPGVLSHEKQNLTQIHQGEYSGTQSAFPGFSLLLTTFPFQ